MSALAPQSPLAVPSSPEVAGAVRGQAAPNPSEIQGTHGEALTERFAPNPITGCWVFRGARDRDGYGHMGSTSAHRYFYEALVGPVPDGLELDHLCVRTNCVNPEHLEPVTGAENLRRSVPYRASRRYRRNACRRGHERNLENSRDIERLDKNGSTYAAIECLVCRRIRNRDYKGRRRAAARLAA